MLVDGVLAVSLGLQLTAAGLALRLIRVTGARWAWLFIAAALVMMASRRAVTLDGLLRHRIAGADLSAELVALAISMLMLAGVASIAPVFGRLRDSEEKLRQSDRELREVIAAAPDGMLFVRDGRCVYASRALSDTLHRNDVETLREQPVVDLAHPDDRKSFAAWLRPAEGKPVAARHEVRFLVPDEGTVAIEVVRGPVVELEGAPATLLVLRDQSERKRLYEQLAQSQKMEAIGQLAGGVAHDFNNLLAVITSYAELLLRSVLPGRPEREDIVEIAKAARRAAALTWQLLAFSRRQVLKPRVLDINDVIVDVEKMLARTLGEHIDIGLSLAPSLWAVTADPGQLEQVLMNLAVNARDAMPTAGKLTIETQNVALDTAYVAQHSGVTAGDYVMLSVSDTGIGMDAKTQARIFEPFFTTKPVGKGTGLGLSTVYGIVHQSGGHVCVDSERGQGTTFSVYFPRTSAAVSARPPPVPSGPAAPVHETVLLVEDDESVRRVADRILRDLGYTVLVAATVDEARSLAEHHPGPIHAMITDIVLPKTSGPALATELRRQRRPQMKVVFMSGYSARAIVDHGGIDEGAVFLEKPFSPDTLASKLREALEPPS